MRAFDTRAVAIAVERPDKFIDNLLSRIVLSGVVGGQQGQPRRITPAAVMVIAAALRLHDALGLAMPQALAISRRLVEEPTEALPIGRHLALTLDLQALKAEVLGRLEAAGEAVIERRRGRPKIKA